MTTDTALQRLSLVYKLLREYSEGLPGFEGFFGGFAVIILSTLESKNMSSATMILKEFDSVWKSASAKEIVEMKRRILDASDLDMLLVLPE